MTLIELLLLLFFAGGGAIIGADLVGWVGGVVGACLGFALLILLSSLVRRETNQWPWCRCGANEPEGFRLVEHQTYDYVRQCQRCGLIYLMRKGYIWDEVLSDGSRRPYIRRGFLGKWKLVGSDRRSS